LSIDLQASRLKRSLSVVPEHAFSAIARLPHPFFLDSAMVLPRLGRFSFLGALPFATLTTRGRSVEMEENGQVRRLEGDPFDALRDALRRYAVDRFDRRSAADRACWPFAGGAVGYLAYDLGRHVEKLPETAIDDIGFPEMQFGFYDVVACYDHAERRAELVAWKDGPETRRRFEQLAHALDRAGAVDARIAAPPRTGTVSGNFTCDAYVAAVQRCKDYIAAGDIFQVNLSQRFDADVSVPPHELYRRLRAVNPAPFACYLESGGRAVLSSSPERFLKVSRSGSSPGWHVETRPIKGTRPRRKADEQFNRAMRQELLASPKDNAELTMIIDLERNDLGRVCSYGSVNVTEKVVLEEYPTVYHLVGTVEGDLRPGSDVVDLLRAAFPGGSITGAPKIRSMEIIEELEPTRRGVYTGAIGYISSDGCADFNIAIRTIVMRGGRAFFQVGGGIVADSDPVAEYDETLTKARALGETLGVAEPFC